MADLVELFKSTDLPSMAEFNEKIQNFNDLIAAGVKIQTGTYVGTGTYGASNPCSLTFDFEPKLLVIYGATWNALWIRPLTTVSAIRIASSTTPSVTVAQTNLIYSTAGNTVSWWNNNLYFATSVISNDVKTVNNSMTATGQLNGNNTTYYYCAIG